MHGKANGRGGMFLSKQVRIAGNHLFRSKLFHSVHDIRLVDIAEREVLLEALLDEDVVAEILLEQNPCPHAIAHLVHIVQKVMVGAADLRYVDKLHRNDLKTNVFKHSTLIRSSPYTLMSNRWKGIVLRIFSS